MDRANPPPLPPVMEAVISAIRGLRYTRVGLIEARLVDMVEEALIRAGMETLREERLGTGCRIDLAVRAADGLLLGIEAKRGRPNAARATAQVARYAATGRLCGIVFVAERAFYLPPEAAGVPIAAVSLQASFGIAL